MATSNSELCPLHLFQYFLNHSIDSLSLTTLRSLFFHAFPLYFPINPFSRFSLLSLSPSIFPSTFHLSLCPPTFLAHLISCLSHEAMAGRYYVPVSWRATKNVPVIDKKNSEASDRCYTSTPSVHPHQRVSFI